MCCRDAVRCIVVVFRCSIVDCTVVDRCSIVHYTLLAIIGLTVVLLLSVVASIVVLLSTDLTSIVLLTTVVMVVICRLFAGVRSSVVLSRLHINVMLLFCIGSVTDSLNCTHNGERDGPPDADL